MLWKQVLPVRPFTGPLLSGDTLIVAGVAAELHGYNTADGKPVGPTFALKGAENEEMLLAAPPHLTAQDSLILVTKGGQVRAVGSAGTPARAPAPAPSPGGKPCRTRHRRQRPTCRPRAPPALHREHVCHCAPAPPDLPDRPACARRWLPASASPLERARFGPNDADRGAGARRAIGARGDRRRRVCAQ